jgi:hypothetical protein
MVPTQPTYDQKGGHRADAQARSVCRIATKKHPLRVRHASPKGVFTEFRFDFGLLAVGTLPMANLWLDVLDQLPLGWSSDFDSRAQASIDSPLHLPDMFA